jgi:hypothetical protein
MWPVDPDNDDEEHEGVERGDQKPEDHEGMPGRKVQRSWKKPTLKEQCHKFFCFRFFMNRLPFKPLSKLLGSILIFFNSRNLQIKVHQWDWLVSNEKARCPYRLCFVWVPWHMSCRRRTCPDTRRFRRSKPNCNKKVKNHEFICSAKHCIFNMLGRDLTILY